MASIDKAAIVFSIAITLVGVGIAAMGGSMDNSPAAPTQQMSSAQRPRRLPDNDDKLCKLRIN